MDKHALVFTCVNRLVEHILTLVKILIDWHWDYEATFKKSEKADDM